LAFRRWDHELKEQSDLAVSGQGVFPPERFNPVKFFTGIGVRYVGYQVVFLVVSQSTKKKLVKFPRLHQQEHQEVTYLPGTAPMNEQGDTLPHMVHQTGKPCAWCNQSTESFEHQHFHFSTDN
jgi:hypothetical protein